MNRGGSQNNAPTTLAEAMRRARHLETLDVAWFEEPLPADDVAAHAELSRHTSVPIAVASAGWAGARPEREADRDAERRRLSGERLPESATA